MAITPPLPSQPAPIHGSDLLQQPAAPPGRPGFDAMIDKLGALQQRADQAVQAVATGQPLEIHRAVLAVEEANLGLRLALQVRNRAIEAYQEVMRMPL